LLVPNARTLRAFFMGVLVVIDFVILIDGISHNDCVMIE
jgi:hypothetical protein